jgi:hypothetical protein
MQTDKFKKWLTLTVLFMILARYLSSSYHDLVFNHTATYTELVELTANINKTLALQAITIIAVLNFVYIIAMVSAKNYDDVNALDTTIKYYETSLYFGMIGSIIGFIIYNLNFCFKPWLTPFKSTIAKILTMPKKGHIGKILGNVMSGEYKDDAYEKQLLTHNPFPLFFSAQSNHLIDFLKYLNPNYGITENTKLVKGNVQNDEFKELYKILATIEKNATLVWVILFAIFFTQTTITFMSR